MDSKKSSKEVLDEDNNESIETVDPILKETLKKKRTKNITSGLIRNLKELEVMAESLKEKITPKLLLEDEQGEFILMSKDQQKEFLQKLNEKRANFRAHILGQIETIKANPQVSKIIKFQETRKNIINYIREEMKEDGRQERIQLQRLKEFVDGIENYDKRNAERFIQFFEESTRIRDVLFDEILDQIVNWVDYSKHLKTITQKIKAFERATKELEKNEKKRKKILARLEKVFPPIMKMENEIKNLRKEWQSLVTYEKQLTEQNGLITNLNIEQSRLSNDYSSLVVEYNNRIREMNHLENELSTHDPELNYINQQMTDKLEEQWHFLEGKKKILDQMQKKRIPKQQKQIQKKIEEKKRN